MGAVFFIVDEHEWADDSATGNIPPEMLEEARQRGGGGRKFMAGGEAGFHSTWSVMPAGYAMAPHRHDHDEVMVVVGGDAVFADDGRRVRRGDSVVVPAGTVHSFVCGPDGMELVTIARGPARTELVTER
ncbi:MAG TPA: cupin domain-containing protein [Acidimicrobiales bacterium]|nr:cupin domain-containing protein [Acidimicrobiales bacterium]